MKTYIFLAEIEQDEDGRWGTEIPTLPGCNAWGYTKEEALEALQDVAQAFVEIMLENNEPIPADEAAQVQSQPKGASISITTAATIPSIEKH